MTAAAAHAAGRFLDTAWQARFASSPVAATQGLALAGLCGWLARDLDGASRRFVSRLLDATGGPALGASDLTTALFAAAAVVRFGPWVPEAVTEYLQLLSQSIPAEEVHANAVAARLALHGEAQPAAGPMRRLTLEPRLLRTGEGQDIRKGLAEIERGTAWGTAPCLFEAPLPSLLEGIGLAAFRRYDLPLGMRALRARIYLDSAPSLGLQQGFDFLRFCQAADGSFGDYDSTFARLTEDNREQIIWNVKTAVAVQALWTLTEIEDGSVRLFSRLFGPSGLMESLLQQENIPC